MEAKRPSHGGKAPIKRSRAEDTNDPLFISNEKVQQHKAALEKERRKQLMRAVQKYNRTFKLEVISHDCYENMVKMIRATRNHMDGAGTSIMYKDDLFAFRRNALREDASTNLFTYDMRYGQRKKDADTLHTVSVYGELVFKNDPAVGAEPFQYMVSDNDLCVAIYVDGEEWENPEAFYTLMRFILGCSGKRGGGGAEEDADDEIENLSRLQIVLLQNLFLEVLSHYFRDLVKALNRTVYPQNSFPSPEFIVRCIEDCKQW